MPLLSHTPDVHPGAGCWWVLICFLSYMTGYIGNRRPSAPAGLAPGPESHPEALQATSRDPPEAAPVPSRFREVEFSVHDDGTITVRGNVSIPTNQEWFFAPEWLAGEREADEDIATGRGTVHESAEDMFTHLDALGAADA
jgi:hypothetical protein